MVPSVWLTGIALFSRHCGTVRLRELRALEAELLSLREQEKELAVKTSAEVTALRTVVEHAQRVLSKLAEDPKEAEAEADLSLLRCVAACYLLSGLSCFFPSYLLLPC